MDVGCGSNKRLLDNFPQSESPYTFNVKFSKTAQNSAMSNGYSTKIQFNVRLLGNETRWQHNFGREEIRETYPCFGYENTLDSGRNCEILQCKTTEHQ